MHSDIKNNCLLFQKLEYYIIIIKQPNKKEFIMEPVKRYKIEIEQVWIEKDGSIDYHNALNDDYYNLEEYVVANADEVERFSTQTFTKDDIQEGIDHVNKHGAAFENRVLVDGEGLWHILTVYPYPF